MRKINKVKIIEVGRTFSSEELNQIRGGECEPHTTCTGSEFKSCDSSGFLTCSQPSVAGFESDGESGNVTCNSGHVFTVCTSSGETHYASCGSEETYTNCESGEAYAS